MNPDWMEKVIQAQRAQLLADISRDVRRIERERVAQHLESLDMLDAAVVVRGLGDPK